MTINITSGSSGWGNYVLYGTKEKPRDSEKVQFLEGDIALGDRLSQSNNYEESYYKIVLAFEGKPSDEIMKSAYEDFKKEMFVGFKEDEYHIDSVIHKDTDNYHIHARVPKQNLKTDTHLQLYMDKIDRPRKELIQDHISLKYGFNIARETNREVFKEQSHEHINKWREEHNQKPFDFSNKKAQAEAEAQINGYLSELVKTGLIEKREDITATLQELGLKIEKENGLDIKKDFAYTTVSNETGKLRIKGEIHHDRFYANSQKDRSSQIDNNRRIEPNRGSIEERAKQVQKELRRANEKRFNKVTELFKVARTRAEAEHSKTLENGRVESLNSSKSIKSNIRAIDRNTDTKTANQVGAVHREQKFPSNRQKQLSAIQPKRADLRQSKTNLLLQNKIKERANERHYSEAIERIRGEREAQQKALQRATEQRKAVQSGASRGFGELQKGITKIADYYGTIREKTVNTFNEMKQSLREKLNRITNKLEVGKGKSKDQLTELVEKYEAHKGDKSDSSNLVNKKELTSREKFEIQKEIIREQIKQKSISLNEVKEIDKPTKSKGRGYRR